MSGLLEAGKEVLEGEMANLSVSVTLHDLFEGLNEGWRSLVPGPSTGSHYAKIFFLS